MSSVITPEHTISYRHFQGNVKEMFVEHTNEAFRFLMDYLDINKEISFKNNIKHSYHELKKYFTNYAISNLEANKVNNAVHVKFVRDGHVLFNYLLKDDFDIEIEWILEDSTSLKCRFYPTEDSDKFDWYSNQEGKTGVLAATLLLRIYNFVCDLIDGKYTVDKLPTIKQYKKDMYRYWMNLKDYLLDESIHKKDLIQYLESIYTAIDFTIDNRDKITIRENTYHVKDSIIDENLEFVVAGLLNVIYLEDSETNFKLKFNDIEIDNLEDGIYFKNNKYTLEFENDDIHSEFIYQAGTRLMECLKGIRSKTPVYRTHPPVQ